MEDEVSYLLNRLGNVTRSGIDGKRLSKIIQERYFANKQFKKIATDLGIGGERVRQLQNKALEELRYLADKRK